MPRKIAKPGDPVSPGRPRSASVDRAVLRAAFTLFIERGLAGTSIERIAKRAGVARTSIYRRWHNRDALLVDAIEAARNEFAPGYSAEIVDHASPADFLRMVLGVGELLSRPEARRLVARLVGTIPDNPLLIEAYRETYYAPRRRALVRAFQRLQAAGMLPAEADAEMLADMMGGVLIYRLLFAFGGEEELSAYVRRLLQTIGLDLGKLAL